MKALGGLAICWKTFTCTNGFTPELALIPQPNLKASGCPLSYYWRSYLCFGPFVPMVLADTPRSWPQQPFGRLSFSMGGLMLEFQLNLLRRFALYILKVPNPL